MPFTLSTDEALHALDISRGWEELPLGEVLTQAWQTWGSRAAIGTSFQGAGLVIIHHAQMLGLPFPVFTLDTGLLFPETLELKARLEDRFHLPIESLQPDLTVEEQNREYAPELWRSDPDLCCTLRKVVPLQRRLSTLDVWITGVRRDQSDTRQSAGLLELYPFAGEGGDGDGRFIYKFNPLANWSRERVQAYLKEHDIPTNPLLLRGYRSIGCMTCTRPVSEGASERAGRWEGFDKTECGIHTFLGKSVG